MGRRRKTGPWKDTGLKQKGNWRGWGQDQEGKPQNLAVTGHSREGKEVKDESPNSSSEPSSRCWGWPCIHPIIIALLPFFHHSSIHSTDLPTCQSTHPSLHLFIHSSIHPPIHPSTNMITHTHTHTHTPIYPPFCPSTLSRWLWALEWTLQWNVDSAMGKGRTWQGQGRRGRWGRWDLTLVQGGVLDLLGDGRMRNAPLHCLSATPA